jgi:hypothetical protein
MNSQDLTSSSPVDSPREGIRVSSYSSISGLNCIVHTILFLSFIKMNSRDLTSPSPVDSPHEGIRVRTNLIYQSDK